MNSKKKEKQTERRMREAGIRRPILERVSRMKALLQGCRAWLDEDLEPLGITTSQLRMLWMIAENPGISGAKVARLCSVTPQSGQTTLAMMEGRGWVRRRPSEASDRVLVAELTGRGERVLVKARKLAKALDARLWDGMSERDLAGLDAALRGAMERLSRG